uniref:Mutt domain protein n=1 Tax=Solanum tuberosum TaxID=4113 RepID=M0ZQG2_SOLTU
MSMCKSVDMEGLMKFSSSFLDSKLMFGVNVAPSFCSHRGLLTKASYSSTSYDATRSVSKKNFLEDTFSYKINSTNHTSLYFRDKWLLDASDDEYGGVLINAERLPSDPDKFTFVLRASLSHWKVKIDTEFVEVMAFRHVHDVAFQKSDLFFVCLLRPLSKQIMVDDVEIQDAKWMPLVEFVEQPLIQEDDMFKKIIDIFIARLGKRYCGLSVHQLVSKFDDKLSTLYFNTVDDPNLNCQAS